MTIRIEIPGGQWPADWEQREFQSIECPLCDRTLLLRLGWPSLKRCSCGAVFVAFGEGIYDTGFRSET